MTRVPSMTKVDGHLIRLLAYQAEDLMDKSPSLRQAWMDQCATSKASIRTGGVLSFMGDWDWPIAFFIWRTGGSAKLKRDRGGRAIPDHLPWDDRELYGNS